MRINNLQKFKPKFVSNVYIFNDTREKTNY